MFPKITNEQRNALRAHVPGQPVRVEDDEDNKVYFLVAEADLPQLWDDYVRVEVDKGLDAVERGELRDWDPEKMKQRARDEAAKSVRNH
jgi:hypothetical protein